MCVCVCLAYREKPTRTDVPDVMILIYLVIYDSGYVSLEHLLLSWYPSLLTDNRFF